MITLAEKYYDTYRRTYHYPLRWRVSKAVETINYFLVITEKRSIVGFTSYAAGDDALSICLSNSSYINHLTRSKVSFVFYETSKTLVYNIIILGVVVIQKKFDSGLCINSNLIFIKK